MISHPERTVEREASSNSDRATIIAVLAADNNYAMPLAVTIRSVLENLGDGIKIRFYIIDGGITDANKQKILKSTRSAKCELEFINIPPSLIDSINAVHQPMASQSVSTKADYVSIASFYRLILPELLPESLEKVIYLDCDLIVENDLKQLWEIDLADNYVLAARDTWIPSISSPNARIDCQRLGIDSDARYFNAGVLVVNLKKWRSERFSQTAIAYFQQNLDSIGWYDQGLLNVLLIERWGQLDPRWNFNATSFYDYSSQDYLGWANSQSFISEDIYECLVRQPYIIHYVSAKKPWTSRHCPRKAEFFKYVDLTAWAGWRLTLWRRLQRRLAGELTTAIAKIGRGQR